MNENNAKNKPYWDIKNKTETSVDLYLYSEICPNGELWGDTSAKGFAAAVKALGNISQLNVFINSPGGSVNEGMAIRAFLARQQFRKDVYIDGICASTATVIAFGIGGTVHMEKTALAMVHSSWAAACGNADEFRKCAEMLDKYDANIRSVYANRTGGKLTEEEINAMMTAETWFTADECLEYGFIDEIVDGGVQAAACLPKEYFDRFKNVPECVSRQPEPDDPLSIKITPDMQAVIDKANSVLKEYEYRKEKLHYGS